jgi:hypothetical protein
MVSPWKDSDNSVFGRKDDSLEIEGLHLVGERGTLGADKEENVPFGAIIGIGCFVFVVSYKGLEAGMVGVGMTFRIDFNDPRKPGCTERAGARE